jgi:Na+/melibiose symporter-like transporter
MNASPQTSIEWRQCLSYGLMGFPLAFFALPMYVMLPNHYAREFGVPLAALGAVMFATRLFDGLVDPWIGRWCDHLYRRSIASVLRLVAFASVLLSLGLALLFFPPWRDPSMLLWASAALLMLTYASFSTVTLALQSWGALLGGGALVQSRLVAWREGLGLLGILFASVVPALLGLPWLVALCGASLVAGCLALSRAPRPPLTQVRSELSSASGVWRPFSRAPFVRLFAVFVINGIASAVPATLVLFFVQDRLQASSQMEPLFLGTYFLCAAASMPLWLQGVKRFGLARSWLAGMLLSVLVFIGTSALGAGDAMSFILICALSGLALGADLALPGTMLAGVMTRAGDLGQAQGAYFGWWNFAGKLNLALAAGSALPLLAWMGYQPGARDASSLQALTIAYCVIPCVLKLLAASLLYLLILHRPRSVATRDFTSPKVDL